MLALSFPRTDFWFLAWIGLIPLMIALDGKARKHSFWLGCFCGFLFFNGTLCWLFNITKWFSFIAGFGVIMLFLYLSLYFGLFAIGYNYFWKKEGVQCLFLIPCVWVATEFVRANLFSGFSWATLGLSQYKQFDMIQVADITGMFGLSFLIVLVNVAIKMLFSSSKEEKFYISIITIAVLCATYLYGQKEKTVSHPYTTNRIGLVQANIDQDDKFNQSLFSENLLRHMALTEEVARKNPDLIIWPETSLPGVLYEDGGLPLGFQDFVKKINIPILAGIVTHSGIDYFNSAILLNREGMVDKKYDKVHLVPFGEFVPLRKYIPFLSWLIPIDDFTAGGEFSVFQLEGKDGKSFNYSVLICFEDAVPSLARSFVNKGASFLVNITNDGWFGNSKAKQMHLQSSVFRAIENRRPVVRAANTGVSAIVDYDGWITYLDNKGGLSNESLGDVFSFGSAPINTFYTKYGDVFTYLCFGCIIMCISINSYIKRKQTMGGAINEK